MSSTTTMHNDWDLMPLTLDVEQVAEIFQTTPAVVHRWARTGTIRGIHLGKKWLFSRDYIHAIVDGTEMVRFEEVAQ